MSLLDLESYYDSRLQRYIDPRKALEIVDSSLCKNLREYVNSWKRRARQYVCMSKGCDRVWHGRGNRNSAKRHFDMTGHQIIRGDPDGKHKVISWGSVA